MRIAAISIALALLAHRSEAKPLTCAQVAPDHAKAETDTKAAYDAALQAKKLAPVTLESRPFQAFPTEKEATAAVRGTPWKQFTLQVDGKPRAAITSEVYRSEFRRHVTAELVKDERGDIWRVQRAATAKTMKTVQVKACQWGCWGDPGGGMNRSPEYSRDVWLLPANSTYRGDVTIAYVAPTLVVTYVPENCAGPP